jgi:hypothetical protein
MIIIRSSNLQPSASRTSSLFRPIPAPTHRGWAIFNRPLNADSVEPFSGKARFDVTLLAVQWDPWVGNQFGVLEQSRRAPSAAFQITLFGIFLVIPSFNMVCTRV